MNGLSLLRAAAANLELVLHQHNLFLLSHMRANTSLFGHLLGNHPEVEGYYEMHIGYHSWKSLWRQKLLHFRHHRPKPQARYMFDKLLHDGHAMAPGVLCGPRVRAVFMLREPEQSIKSLVALYRQRSPHLPEATPDGATAYYVQRLSTLEHLAATMGPRYFYLDAEALIERTDAALAALRRWLQLSSPLSSTYETFAMTGQRNAGDPSTRLKSGRVQRGGRDYRDIALDPGLVDAARQAHQRCRAALVAGSQAHVVWPEAHAASVPHSPSA